MNANNNKLAEWELKHVGQQTFSKAFYPLVQYISLNKAMEARRRKHRSPNRPDWDSHFGKIDYVNRSLEAKKNSYAV